VRGRGANGQGEFENRRHLSPEETEQAAPVKLKEEFKLHF
jgi:hypothetical protein